MGDALLLEWDGILVDTRALRAQALARALEEERLPPGFATSAEDGPDDEADVEQVIGDALARGGHADDQTLREIVALRARRAFAERLAQGVSLVPGGAEFLASCESRARIVIVTRAARTETEQLMRQAGWEAMTSSIVASDDVAADGAPGTQIARALDQLSRRGISRVSDVILVGRAISAFRAARSLGVRTVVVGAPAHVAVEADGAVSSLVGQTFDSVARLARSTVIPNAR